MNIKKPVDYSDMFLSLDMLMAKGLPQMKLYREIGGLVSSRPEKGAAAAAAEYLQRTYPDTAGFSPRNLRRMREFYRAYADMPEILSEAMRIDWTQNVVILEAELTPREQLWYIKTVQQCGWSKTELLRQIKTGAHLDLTLDLPDEVCYTEENAASEAGASHAKAEDHQCNGAGIIGIAGGIPPILFLLYPQLFHRRLHAQPLLVCEGGGRPMGMADGGSPPGRGGLWQTLLQESWAGQPGVVSRSAKLPKKRLRLRCPVQGGTFQLPGKACNGRASPRGTDTVQGSETAVRTYLAKTWQNLFDEECSYAGLHLY